MNAEHTWADAPVMAHMFEEVLYDDMTRYVITYFLLKETQLYF